MSNWIQRLNEDRSKLDESSKLELIRATLMYTNPFLTLEETETFLIPQENLSNPDVLISYSNIEKKVALAYSGGYDENSKKWEREKYLKVIRNALAKLYSPLELNELESLLIGPWDVSAFVIGIAGDHYGMRRIRNAYLPEITDLIQVDLETGKGQNLTRQLFEEGPEDSVSRIERVLGVKENNP